jgi:transcriptional regulator
MGNRPQQLKGNLDLLLLSVLRDAPAHGYEVITTLKQRSGGVLELPEGTIYPALHRLEKSGHVSSSWQVREGRRRCIYKLTAPGLRALKHEIDEWREFSSSVESVVSWAI